MADIGERHQAAPPGQEPAPEQGGILASFGEIPDIGEIAREGICTCHVTLLREL